MSLIWLHTISLLLIAATWLFAWRVGCRFAHGCAVHEQASRWALGCILPTAGLICSVHMIALASLVSGRGWLTPEPVLLVYVILMLAAGRYGRDESLQAQTASGTGQVISHRFRTTVAESFARSTPRLGWWWLPVLIVTGMYAVFLIDAITRYPTGYDGLYYHLPSAVRWMQQRSMDLIVGLSCESLPENGMIVPCLLSFAKLERLLPATQLPSALLVGLAIYGLTRAVGGSLKSAVVCVCITMSIPIVAFQSFSSYIDLYGASSWLAALLAVVWATRTRQVRQRNGLLFLAGLSAGVALGSKSTYLVLVLMLGVIVVLAEWIPPRVRRTSAPTPWRSAAIFGSAALVCSGFWFIRGTVQANNPVYPMTFKIGGQKVLPGFTEEDRVSFHRSAGRKFRHWWDYPWRESKHGTGYGYGVDNGLGATYAAFVPLGLVAAVFFVAASRSRGRLARWRLVFLLLAGSGGLLLVTAFGEHLRFVLPLLLVSVPAAAAFIDRLIVKAPGPTLATLTIALIVTAAVATLKPMHALAGRIKDDAWGRSSFYQVPAMIDKFEPGTRILNCGSPTANYPLLGRSLGNVVIGPAQWKMLLGGERMSAQTLREHAIDYIFVQAPWPIDWPDDLPTKLLFDSTAARATSTIPVRIYRVPHNQTSR